MFLATTTEGVVVFDSEIQDIIQRTHNVKSFRIASREGADYKAGQFMQVAIKVNGEEQGKYFTISNSPTRAQYIEFTKKITESDFSRALDRMKPGDRLHIDMPKGAFTLDKAGQKIAFLSGGIGITPIFSMCQYATDKKLDADIVLLYGNRAEKDIVFFDELEELQQENQHLRVIHTLEDPSDKTSWKGRTGLISRQMILEDMPDYAQRTFFVCGPPQMVKGLSHMLINEIGLPPEKIVKENFMGY